MRKVLLNTFLEKVKKRKTLKVFNIKSFAMHTPITSLVKEITEQ